MILFAGLLIIIWLVALTAVAVHVSGVRWRASKGTLFGVLFLLLPLLLFLLRPDEDMEAGEDAAGYLHRAISFAREQRVHFVDSGLALVSPEQRPLFRYGHAGFMATKDAVLWSPDRQSVDVGPHFLPAHSILLSVPVSLGFTYGAFWISPLLALLGAFLSGLLVRGLVDSPWAGWLAGAAYLLNPVAAWNARAIRAEWSAAVLVLGGLVLLHACWSARRPVMWWVGWLAGFSLAGAMLFHITAVYVLLPVMVVVLWCRIRQPLPFWLGVAVGWGLLLLQLVYVSDPYWVLAQFGTWQRRIALGVAVVLLIAFPLVTGWFWRWCCDRISLRKCVWAKAFGLFLSVGFLMVVFLAWRYRRDDGAIFFLPANYISLTDFQGVARLFSRFWFAVMLAGFPVLVLRGGEEGDSGRRFACFLFPAALVVGWMNNYMFETRRLLLAWLPLSILSSVLFCWWCGRTVRWALGRYRHVRCLPNLLSAREDARPPLSNQACLANLEGERPREPVTVEAVLPASHVSGGLLIERFVMLALAGVCLAAGARGRMPLYRTWNHKGMYRFYQEISATVREQGDVLLATYTQTAVPVERLSGLPLLPVSWGYRSEKEFRRAELVFKRLVQDKPDKRFLFLTPFQGAALPGLALEKVADWQLQSASLARARHSVPDRQNQKTRRLSLYRVHPTMPDTASFPYVRLLDGDRFGIKGDANLMPDRRMELEGVKVSAGGLVLDAILPHAAGPSDRLLLFLATPDGDGNADGWELKRPDSTVAVQGHRISDKWSALMIAGRDLAAATLIPKAQVGIYLTDAFLLQADAPPLRLVTQAAEPFKMESVDSQWLRANGSIALPVGHDQRLLCLHATAGRDIDGMVQMSVTPVSGSDPAVSVPVANRWQWIVLPLPGTGDGRFEWYDVQVVPPWNPGIRGFPDDLGLRVSTVLVE